MFTANRVAIVSSPRCDMMRPPWPRRKPSRSGLFRMLGELESHRARVIVEPAVLDDQEQRLLFAVVVVGMHGDRRRDRGGPWSPLLAPSVDQRETPLPPDDQRDGHRVVPVRA